MNSDLISRSHFDERVRLAGGPDADEEYSADFLDGVKTVMYMLSTEPAFPQEMTAREFVKARRRLCEAHLNAITQSVDDFVTRCEGCVLENYCEGSKDNVDDEVAIVEQWAKEHPEKKRKTYAEDFITRYPKCAVRTVDGITYPIVCRAQIYKDIVCRRETPSDCAACWNEVMEDED